ncbi:hypothetical protein NSQ61_19965 [Aeribacillus sp. FSL K6-1121]|uniref:hypothetical protein n=1 Tax=Aeribacillus sp. FSL K6-1121 TaxID=2954745 RepID=UPI0030FB37B3
MNTDLDLVIQDMQNQIANLSREKAIFYALAVQREQELQKVKKELEEMKMKKEEKKGDK